MTYESAQTRVFLQDYLCNLLLTSRNVFVKSKVRTLGGAGAAKGIPPSMVHLAGSTVADILRGGRT